MPFQIPSHDDCAFCRNVSGLPVVSRIDGETVGCAVIESLEETFAFINPYQFSPPHILVIPKRHAATILDLTSEEATAVMCHVHRLAKAVAGAFTPIA